jgi:DinB superfamily
VRPLTPYTRYLGDRDPLEAIRDSVARVETLARAWTPDRFERSYAAGKWSARQVLTHLAQTEIALGTRARMAVASPNHAAQSWDQDSWIPLDAHMSGRQALDTFIAIARMNLAFFEGLSPAQRANPLTHPEYGDLTVDWILHQMAGHHINHLLQLERIAQEILD